MNTEFKVLLGARAKGKCECCGVLLRDLGEADHFFSRARAEENEFTVWLLHPVCHRQKTANNPNGPYWFRLFIKHCERWAIKGDPGNGYVLAAERARKRLDFVVARAALGQGERK